MKNLERERVQLTLKAHCRLFCLRQAAQPGSGHGSAAETTPLEENSRDWG